MTLYTGNSLPSSTPSSLCPTSSSLFSLSPQLSSANAISSLLASLSTTLLDEQQKERKQRLLTEKPLLSLQIDFTLEEILRRIFPSLEEVFIYGSQAAKIVLPPSTIEARDTDIIYFCASQQVYLTAMHAYQQLFDLISIENREAITFLADRRGKWATLHFGPIEITFTSASREESYNVATRKAFLLPFATHRAYCLDGSFEEAYSDGIQGFFHTNHPHTIKRKGLPLLWLAYCEGLKLKEHSLREVLYSHYLSDNRCQKALTQLQQESYKVAAKLPLPFRSFFYLNSLCDVMECGFWPENMRQEWISWLQQQLKDSHTYQVAETSSLHPLMNWLSTAQLLTYSIEEFAYLTRLLTLSSLCEENVFFHCHRYALRLPYFSFSMRSRLRLAQPGAYPYTPSKLRSLLRKLDNEKEVTNSSIAHSWALYCSLLFASKIKQVAVSPALKERSSLQMKQSLAYQNDFWEESDQATYLIYSVNRLVLQAIFTSKPHQAKIAFKGRQLLLAAATVLATSPHQARVQNSLKGLLRHLPQLPAVQLHAWLQSALRWLSASSITATEVVEAC